MPKRKGRSAHHRKVNPRASYRSFSYSAEASGVDLIGTALITFSCRTFLASRKVARNLFKTVLSRLPKLSRRISRPATISAARSSLWECARSVTGDSADIVSISHRPWDIAQLFVGHESDLIDARSASSGSIGSAPCPPALSGLPLIGARSAKHTRQSIIPFVASMLVHMLIAGNHRNLRLPRLRERRRIVDLKLIKQDIRSRPSEPLDQMQILIRPAELRLSREVRRINY